MATQSRQEIATFGAGCFWCTEAVYLKLRGINRIEAGYAGGHVADPNYDQVCRGSTGHAEVIRVDFDTQRISYRDLLNVFFHTHDPTTPNRQGNDVGTQYRSVIFFHSQEQKKTAEEVIAEINQTNLWPKPIVTEVVMLSNYFPAEDCHQNFFNRNPSQAYCLAVIPSKLEKLGRKFPELLKDKHPIPPKLVGNL